MLSNVIFISGNSCCFQTLNPWVLSAPLLEEVRTHVKRKMVYNPPLVFESIVTHMRPLGRLEAGPPGLGMHPARDLGAQSWAAPSLPLWGLGTCNVGLCI